MEIVRRLFNTSEKLDWNEYAVPCLNDYMKRMQLSGYNENYRKHVLKQGLGIFDSMLKKDKEGLQPINRPKYWNRSERIKRKRKKEKDWSTRGDILPQFLFLQHQEVSLPLS